MACLGMGDDQVGAKNIESDGPTPQGERTPRPRMWIPISSRFPGAFSIFFPFFLLGDLWCYISFSLVHPPPTLVSYPCPYLSARPIGHSFWLSVSCCGPLRIVQGSRPHKWGQGVSCGYLIRRWQLLLELLFYHAPMAGLLGSKLPLGCSRGLPLATWRFPLSRYQKGPSPPLQVAGETPGGRLLRSTNIGFWIRVRFRAALASGNQFRRSRLFFLLTAYAKHTDLVAAGTRLWIHHHHQPSSFYLLALQQACLGCSVVSCKTSLP